MFRENYGKYLSLIVVFILFCPVILFAQSYEITTSINNGNPGGLNTDGDNTFGGEWVELFHSSADENIWSEVHSIPFDFEFYNTPVTEFKFSLNGLITFDTSVTGTPPNDNVSLPSADLPDNTIACFWDEFSTDPPMFGRIYVKTFGTAPDRQFWIRHHAFEYSSYDWSYFAVVLEETTNSVYLVDCNVFDDTGTGSATVGVQQNNTNAVQLDSSPNYVFNDGETSYTDNDYYQFFPIGSTLGIASNPDPADETYDVSVEADLSWTFANGTETYDLILDTTYPPSTLVVNNATATTAVYDPGTMLNNTTYYWQIIGRNSTREEVPGYIWSFTTMQASHALPFTEDFEGDLSNWTAEGSVTASPGWPYTGAQSARYTAYGGMETSSIHVRLEASLDPNLSFWYLVRDNTTNDITVDIKEAGATTWTTTIWDMPVTSPADQYIFVEVDLTSYNTEDGPFWIKLNGRAFQSGYQIWKWVFIDDVEVTETTIFPPTDLMVDEATGLFTWNAPTGNIPNGYEVCLDGILLDTVTETQYQFTGLENGQTYIAGVAAVYDDGTSATINYEFTYSIYFEPPSNLSVDETTGLFIWDAPVIQNPNSYDVYLDNDLQDNVINNEYQFTGLENGQSYIAGVAAVYEDGTSTIFDFEFTYQPIIPPVNLIAEIQTFNDVLLNWDTPADDVILSHREERNETSIKSVKITSSEFNTDETRDLTGYKVYKDNVEIADITDPAILSYTDSGVEPGAHEYYLTAVYDGGESDPSNLVSVEIILPVPQNVVAFFVEPNVILTWDAISTGRDLFGYSVYRDGEEIATNIIGTNYTDPGLPTGEYTYNIIAIFDGNWESELSADAVVEVTNVNNNLIIPLITKLQGNYPNPFNPYTTIKFALHENQNVTLIIYNIRGEKVCTLVSGNLEAGYHNIPWNGKDDSGKTISSGIYFYMMKAGKLAQTKKMILMK
ncbi:MAG: T9SS type A sorting domain-containing protein [Candidatus Cloacimonetes bacterium]|nr:T9SS type A sorting domain-containing protein [Candidatus Cloacimonadota bacterium]